MHDTYIGRRSENNIKCVMHVDLRRKNRTAQYNLPCYWLYEWFSQFHSCGTYSVLSQSHRLLSYTLWMVLKGIEWCLCWRAIRKLLTLAEALQCQTDFHLPVTSQPNLCSARSCFFKIPIRCRHLCTFGHQALLWSARCLWTLLDRLQYSTVAVDCVRWMLKTFLS